MTQVLFEEDGAFRVGTILSEAGGLRSDGFISQEAAVPKGHPCEEPERTLQVVSEAYAHTTTNRH